MRVPRSYIVRIYRRGFRTLSGVVEDTRTNTQQSFSNVEELLATLRAPNSRAPSRVCQGRSRSPKPTKGEKSS